jgi:predicted CXXCH cytochrome family protein
MTGQACASCHDAHASTTKGLLTRASAGEVCLACHDKEIQARDRNIDNIAARLNTNPHHHGPLSSGDCAACHNAHGSKWPALASQAYPGDFYVAFRSETYQLCFECHEATAFASAETEDATGFRNGTQNLHYVHVNKSFKGRACHACHDPHASKNDKHIAEGVRFGKWTIPINFRPSPTGGSCGSGCHRPYGYDREQPVANVGSR